MSASSVATAQSSLSDRKTFVTTANAAMRRASRQVAAENKRLGLPLIVEKPQRKTAPAGKRVRQA